ncbi:MAG: HAMP domain-containing sensor histidine kinase [Anaerovoracaceae bacterium]
MKKLSFFLLLVTGIFALAGLLISSACSVLILLLGLALWGVSLWFARRQYREICRLSSVVDRVLHGGEFFALEDNKEGELAILESEIYKMTIRLRENAHALEKDKIYLTDAIADISHQLRTPLTTINLLVSFLQKKELSDGERREHVREISKHLARIDWLITSLLKLSKIDAGTAGFKRERVQLSDLIARAVEPLMVPMELREQVFDFASKGRETYRGDLNWSVEALGNIIKNCMEHTPEGGHIWVMASENTLYTQIIIKDNGEGIDPKDLPHLFERFYRGKNSNQSGVGIGLALARKIISEQNGTIKVENDKQGGAKFTIRFYKGIIV